MIQRNNPQDYFIQFSFEKTPAKKKDMIKKVKGDMGLHICAMSYNLMVDFIISDILPRLWLSELIKVAQGT